MVWKERDRDRERARVRRESMWDRKEWTGVEGGKDGGGAVGEWGGGGMGGRAG